MALAVAALVGAGLFIGSFVNLMRVDPGFDYHDVLLVDVGVGPVQVHSAAKHSAGGRKARPSLRPARCSRRSAACRVWKRRPPSAVASADRQLEPDQGRDSRQGEQKGDDSIDRRTVTPDYLQVLRIPLIRGRYLSAEDTETSQPVVVINRDCREESLARRDALGQRMKINNTGHSPSWASSQTSGTSDSRFPPGSASLLSRRTASSG